ncbi:CHRD domain-containing protein [Tunicatimonas pelagia]|uniref:CHRD domain-containing protein n=1 Tax=Tunicatimonas pelagia TaxID=931531 RepID=UPI002666A813|nr:CHRD domain-containing protein [Tunicatimonas pelagia]WKN45742.1 CHRD domain-containing protein [Tunicatimonas pelagia]
MTTLKFRRSILFLSFISLFLVFSACDEDEGFTPPTPDNTPSKVYFFNAVNGADLAGYIEFSPNDDNTVDAEIVLSGTEPGNTHPAAIRANSAVEGGDITVELEAIEGATGRSLTTLSNFNYEQILTLDNYVSVQLSESDQTVVAQADIGTNELSGESKEYALALRDNSGTTGALLLEQRNSGETLATITLDSVQNLTDGASHPAHIHNNTALETGGIAFTFTPVSGTTGMSMTHIATLDDGTAITYEQLLDFDGYVNVHESMENLATLIVQGDIGANELTGDEVTYPLMTQDVDGIMGEATFEKRQNGETVATLSLEGTPEGGEHPAHIHFNTAAEGGGVAVSFTPVNGTTGMSMTNIAATDDGTAITYDSLLNYDGYINVHLSAEDLATIVAQGDMGQNALTGETITYVLDSVAMPDIKGEAIFSQRNNGTTLVELTLQNTIEGGTHPAHIHANTAAEGGGIVIDLNDVDGTTGMSRTQVAAFDDGTPVTYEGLLDYDGYINVHISDDDLPTIVAQGDIGANALTGNSVTYNLGEVAGSGVSGTATFAERKDGSSRVTLVLSGTPTDGNHPARIHFNSVEEKGNVAIELSNVSGASGISQTSVMAQNNNVTISYDELIQFDGHINVHPSPDDLTTIVAQGDIGANAPE